MRKLHLTINNFSDTSITTSQWPIYGEPERIAVRFEGKEYATVLDSPPYFEVWTLDSNGELFELETVLFLGPLGEKGFLQTFKGSTEKI